MLEPPEIIRRYVSLLTGKDFLPLNPDRYPHDRIRWLMYATFGRDVAETPYIHRIWAELDEDTTLHLESEPLGDTLDVTEWTYGDESLFDRGRFDLTGFEKTEGRNEYAEKFPRVVERLNSYEEYASEQAAKLGVDIRLLFHGSNGIASFYLEAKFETIGVGG